MTSTWAVMVDDVSALRDMEVLEARVGAKAKFAKAMGRRVATLAFSRSGYSIHFIHVSLLPKDLRRAGASLVADAVHFYPDGRDGYRGFAEPFPEGLVFGDLRTTVEHRLGSAVARGGGDFNKILGAAVPHWAVFQLGICVLHMEFDDEARLSFVTLMHAGTRPGG